MSEQETNDVTKQVTDNVKKSNRFWTIVTTMIIGVATTSICGVVKWAANDVKTAITTKVDTWDAAASKIQTVSADFEKHEARDSVFMLRLCKACPKLIPSE